MHLSRHHLAALVAATGTSAIALTDAVTHGITGHYSVFSDDSGVRSAVVASGLVHGLTYVALLVVLLRERARFAASNRVARGARWIVMISLGFLALGFLTLVPFLNPRGGDGPVATALNVLVGPAFAGMILGSLVLGLALLRSAALGVGARVLACMLPVLGVTALLGWLAPDWAHPAYLETTLNFGIALLGVGTAGVAASSRARSVAVPARGHGPLG